MIDRTTASCYTFLHDSIIVVVLVERKYDSMLATGFNEGGAGRIVRTLQGYWTFLPNPLPPPLSLTWELVRELSDADRALSELAGIARTLPNPHLLINPFIRREAVLSSRIEGTQASLSDLFYFEAAGTSSTDTSDVQEVVNYVRALEYGLARLKELPISLRLIREMHQRLMEGVRGEQMLPGEFRKRQNWIGRPRCQIEDADFVPPPPSEMTAALDELEQYLHQPSPLPPLVRLALIHYQFEAIHPFLDGNGRIGRLLITLTLCAEGLLPLPLLYLSAYFERHRDQYYDLLLAVSQAGKWTEWISFFLRGVAEQSRDAIQRSDKLLRLWREYRERLQSARASALSLRLIDALFTTPALSVGQAGKILNVTHRAAQLNIDRLVEAGIVQEVTGRQRNRIYLAATIGEILAAPDAG